MCELSVLVLLLFQSVVVLLVLFCDSLDFIVLLSQDGKSVLFEVLYLLVKGSFDVLTVGFVDLCFCKKLSDFTFLLFDSLVGKLLLLFDELYSLIIFVTHGIILEGPFSVE